MKIAHTACIVFPLPSFSSSSFPPPPPPFSLLIYTSAIFAISSTFPFFFIPIQRYFSKYRYVDITTILRVLIDIFRTRIPVFTLIYPPVYRYSSDYYIPITIYPANNYPIAQTRLFYRLIPIDLFRSLRRFELERSLLVVRESEPCFFRSSEILSFFMFFKKTCPLD